MIPTVSVCFWNYSEFEYTLIFGEISSSTLFLMLYAGWFQYAKSYKRKCDNKTLGPWRAAEVSHHVGALLPWGLCNCVISPCNLTFQLLCILESRATVTWICWKLVIYLPPHKCLIFIRELKWNV